MADLKEIMAKLPTRVSLGHARSEEREGAGELDAPAKVVVVLTFTETGFGFGEVAIVQTDEGVFLDTESMSLDRVKRYFAMLLDSAVTDNDDDPKKHALYNRVMGRGCGGGCGVCWPKEKTT